MTTATKPMPTKKAKYAPVARKGFRLERDYQYPGNGHKGTLVVEFWVVGDEAKVTGQGDSAGGFWVSIESARERYAALIEKGYKPTPYDFAERCADF